MDVCVAEPDPMTEVRVLIRGGWKEGAILAVMREHFLVTGYGTIDCELMVKGYTAAAADLPTFAHKLAWAIWQVNDLYCYIEVSVGRTQWEAVCFPEIDYREDFKGQLEDEDRGEAGADELV